MRNAIMVSYRESDADRRRAASASARAMTAPEASHALGSRGSADTEQPDFFGGGEGGALDAGGAALAGAEALADGAALIGTMPASASLRIEHPVAVFSKA